LLGKRQKGQAVVGTVLAHRMNLHPGDSFELAAAHGPQQVQVAAVVTDYQVGGMMLYMDRPSAKKLFEIAGADAFLILAKKRGAAALEAELQRFCQPQGLILQSYAEVAASIDRLMSGLEAGLWGILALQFLVAGFGIANTLTMNVLEQTREIGLMRVVGMTRSQVGRMIFGQATLIGLVSLWMGLPGGIVVAWVLSVCEQPVTGQQIDLKIHPWLFLWGSLAALTVVIAAAWWPAKRAARLSPGESLAYE
jgi:putative ABC transport system permease protein